MTVSQAFWRVVLVFLLFVFVVLRKILVVFGAYYVFGHIGAWCAVVLVVASECLEVWAHLNKRAA